MKISFTQANAVRKHAMPFTACLRKSGQDIEKIDVISMTWPELCDVEKEARHYSRGLPNQIDDRANPAKASEVESAFDTLVSIVDAIAEEKDARSAVGSKEPRNRIDTSKRTSFECISVRAADFGDDDIIDDSAFALQPKQSFRSFAMPNSNETNGLSVGRFLRATVMGPANDAERRALAEGADATGGFTVPKTLSADLIDNLRAASVCVQAGAQTIPLDSNKHSIAKLLSDAVPAWRVENAALAESDPTFGQIVFEPKSLAVLVKVSRELLDDSLNIGTALPAVLTAALAQELDRVALIGSGTAPEPRGIINTAGVGLTTLGAALTSYSPLLHARTALLTANIGDPTAAVMNPREEGTLAGLVDTLGQPIMLPPRLASLPMLTSTQLPVATGTMIIGDFTKLMIGLRQDIRIEVLRERYADNHQVAFIAHLRADVAVQHASAFHVIKGITA